MTREEDDRRLALSAGVAGANRAIDNLDGIDMSRTPYAAHDKLTAARWQIVRAVAEMDRELAALKLKAIDEEREAAK